MKDRRGGTSSEDALRTPILAATRAADQNIALQRWARHDLTWMARSACRTVPRSTSAAMLAATSAEDVEILGYLCDGCPVAAECLAMANDLKASGLWGGVVLVDGRRVA